MRLRQLTIAAFCVAAGLAACSPEPSEAPSPASQEPSTEEATVQTADLPSVAPTPEIPVTPVEYSLSLEPAVLPNGNVRFQIQTNIPGEIEVMVGLSLQGQASDDVFVGKKERVKLSNGQGSATLATSKLPKGEYDAEVSFYPRWGFQDSASRATGISENLSASSALTLLGSGESAAAVQTKENGQKWVMEHVGMGDVWRSADWIRMFGDYEELQIDRGNPEILKAYYFPRIDTTLIVNILKNEITVWRLGKAHS